MGLDGIPKEYITIDNLKQFSATAASSGGIALFHLIGITPEAQTMEMVFPEGPKKKIIMTLEHIRDAENQLCNFDVKGQIDLVSLGCPHFSYSEFQDVERFLAGRSINKKTRMWIFTSRSVYATVEESGLLDRIKNLGVEIFVDGCTMEYLADKLGTKTIMTNSGKFGTYCFNKVGIHPVFGNLEECVNTAVMGE